MGISEGGKSGERVVWCLASLKWLFFSTIPEKSKVLGKLRGKSRESQDIISKAYQSALGSGESQGNLKISYLKPMKMQGTSGETQGKLKNS